MASYQDELLETVTCKCYKFLFEALWARITHGFTPLEPGKKRVLSHNSCFCAF